VTTAKTRAILMTAFLCPGVGQVSVGKRRGWIFIAATVILLIWLFINIALIAFQEMSPNVIQNLSPIEYAAAFVRIRHRVYIENIVQILVFLGVWVASIIDLAISKEPESEKPASEKLETK